MKFVHCLQSPIWSTLNPNKLWIIYKDDLSVDYLHRVCRQAANPTVRMAAKMQNDFTFWMLPEELKNFLIAQLLSTYPSSNFCRHVNPPDGRIT